MTANEFNAALVELGFPTELPNGQFSKGQTELARLLGYHDRTIRRFASGTYPVPPTLAGLLNLMLKTKTPPSKLKL